MPARGSATPAGNAPARVSAELEDEDEDASGKEGSAEEEIVCASPIADKVEKSAAAASVEKDRIVRPRVGDVSFNAYTPFGP